MIQTLGRDAHVSVALNRLKLVRVHFYIYAIFILCQGRGSLRCPTQLSSACLKLPFICQDSLHMTQSLGFSFKKMSHVDWGWEMLLRMDEFANKIKQEMEVAERIWKSQTGQGQSVNKRNQLISCRWSHHWWPEDPLWQHLTNTHFTKVPWVRAQIPCIITTEILQPSKKAHKRYWIAPLVLFVSLELE